MSNIAVGGPARRMVETRVVGPSRMPDWVGVVLVASLIWVGVAVARGMTFALTHAMPGM